MMHQCSGLLHLRAVKMMLFILMVALHGCASLLLALELVRALLDMVPLVPRPPELASLLATGNVD